MRRVAVVLILAMVGACSADDSQRPEPSDPSTTRNVPGTSGLGTTTTLPPTTTTTTQPEPDDGTESIGVADNVTIVITDPDNG